MLSPYLCGCISIKKLTLIHYDCFIIVIHWCPLDVSKSPTEIGKQAFMFSAPAAWNHLHTDLQLDRLIPLKAFKNVVKVWWQIQLELVIASLVGSSSSCLSS